MYNNITLHELGESHKSDLIKGILGSIVEVNGIFNLLPFNTSNDSKNLTDTLENDKDLLVTLDTNNADRTGVEVASKAKKAARKYLSLILYANEEEHGFNGLDTVVSLSNNDTSGDISDWRTADGVFKTLDDGLSNNVDCFIMSRKSVSVYKKALREKQENTESVEFPNGQSVLSYKDVPIFVNDYIQGDSQTYVYGLKFANETDDSGITGLFSDGDAGIDIHIDGINTRLRWKCGFDIKNSDSVWRKKILIK